MNRICSVYIAVSLDGFIARENGDLDWLDKASENIPKGEDCGYNLFISNVDVIIMGRNTYEKVLSFGKWPYENIKVIVLSHFLGSDSRKPSQNIEFYNGKPETLVDRLKNEGAKKIYIDGGKTITNFLSNGLIDEIIITIIPVLLGNGIPLFGNIMKDVALKLNDSKAYDFGFVQNTYKVIDD